MRSATAVLALASLVVVVRPAPAWNAVGHMTVARVAYETLSKAERELAHKVFARHPHFDSYLAQTRPSLASVEEWVFLRAATWPDFVRGPLRPAKPDPAVVRYHRPDDHFLDLPLIADGASPAFAEKVRALPARHGIVCALKQRAAELGLRTAADDDRAVALCWLFHLTGDVHQPLHCASLFEEKLLPKGDFGGNAIGFRFGPGKVPQRLHTFWDGLMGVTSDGEIAEIMDTAKHAEEAFKLADLKARALMQAHAPDGLEELKTRREFKDWADESHALAKAVAYADGVVELAVKVPPFPNPVPDTVPLEPDGYSERAKAAADRRAAVAGYRLADLVRRLLPKD